jgi:hypothetical protein
VGVAIMFFTVVYSRWFDVFCFCFSADSLFLTIFLSFLKYRDVFG